MADSPPDLKRLQELRSAVIAENVDDQLGEEAFNDFAATALLQLPALIEEASRYRAAMLVLARYAGPCNADPGEFIRDVCAALRGESV